MSAMAAPVANIPRAPKILKSSSFVSLATRITSSRISGMDIRRLGNTRNISKAPGKPNFRPLRDLLLVSVSSPSRRALILS